LPGRVQMNRRYIVPLSDEERETLRKIISTGEAPAYKIRHAHILLKLNTDGPNWTDEAVADAFGCHANTVANIRQRFVEYGMEAGLARRERQYRPRLVDGKVEAQIIALRCSAPPEGRSGWTLRLLADKLVELEIVPSISQETARQFLKSALRPHLKGYFVIPPEQNAEFVAQMEDILDLYQRPDDPQRPLICMDEQPVQPLQEARHPLPAQPWKPESVDYEYERKGTAALFLFTAPLAGWRRVSVREHRTAVDWAEEVRILLEEDFPDAEKIILICDN